MPKSELTQNVLLFYDEKVLGKQTVTIDTDDPCESWASIIHNGAETSLSCRNFEKLIELYNEAKNELK